MTRLFRNDDYFIQLDRITCLNESSKKTLVNFWKNFNFKFFLAYVLNVDAIDKVSLVYCYEVSNPDFKNQLAEIYEMCDTFFLENFKFPKVISSSHMSKKQIVTKTFPVNYIM